MLSRREEERRERKREERGEKSIYCQKSNKLMNIEAQVLAASMSMQSWHPFDEVTCTGKPPNGIN